MSYQLYILKHGSAPPPLFKSHWVLLVLTNGDFALGTAVGQYIHVPGSVMAGFTFEVKRNWHQSATNLVFRHILIGQVTQTSVALSPPISEYMIDSEGRSLLELALLTQPAPGKSLGTPGERKDCQWWIRQALPHAVAQGHVQLFEDMDGVLDDSSQ